MRFTLEIIVLLISITTALGGAVAWHAATVKRQYAHQRDFEHLKRSYASLAESVKGLMAEVDERADQQMLELKEAKALLTVIITKMGPGEVSTGWFNKPPGA